MKINKLKLLSIVICCFVVSLSEARCAQKVEKNDEPIRNSQRELSAGSIVSFAGEIAPNGWLLCDGQQYSNQRYPELYEVIKEKYVPSGSWVIEANKRSEIEKYFCVPDLRGRVIVGVDGATGRVTSNNTLGTSGGEEMHQLTVAELASHEHLVPIGLVNVAGSTHFRAGQSNTLDARSNSAGGNQPHNNMQPYLILNYIINTGKMDNIQYTNNRNSRVIQVITSFSQEAKSTSTVIPNDKTIPQNTKGTELVTAVIYPTASSSKLMIDFSCPIVSNESYSTNTFALFQDNIVNALNVGFCVGESISRGQPFFMRHIMTSGTTNPATFKIRFGPSLGTMHVLRSQDGTLTYGGIPQYSLTITEILS